MRIKTVKVAAVRKDQDQADLQALMLGYGVMRDRLQARIDEISQQINVSSHFVQAINEGRVKVGGKTVVSKIPAGGRRKMSPAGRARIAAAQKKRWAAHRAEQKKNGKTAK